MEHTEAMKIEKKALEKWGNNQVIVAIEELSELQKELTKYLRGKGNFKHIAEEIADVIIMLDQMQFKFEDEATDIHFIQTVEKTGWKKLERLKKLVEVD